MDLNSLPKDASSLKFTKHNAYIMSLCLTMHVNLGLSLRKTRQALKDLYNISISHQQVANYCKTAAICIKPFVDNYNYDVGKVFTADETYIKYFKKFSFGTILVGFSGSMRPIDDHFGYVYCLTGS